MNSCIVHNPTGAVYYQKFDREKNKHEACPMQILSAEIESKRERERPGEKTLSNEESVVC